MIPDSLKNVLVNRLTQLFSRYLATLLAIVGFGSAQAGSVAGAIISFAVTAVLIVADHWIHKAMAKAQEAGIAAKLGVDPGEISQAEAGFAKSYADAMKLVLLPLLAGMMLGTAAVTLMTGCATLQAVGNALHLQPTTAPTTQPATAADVLDAFDKDYQDGVNVLSIIELAGGFSDSEYAKILADEAKVDAVRTRAKAIVDAGGDAPTVQSVLNEVAAEVAELKSKKTTPKKAKAQATTQPS